MIVPRAAFTYTTLTMATLLFHTFELCSNSATVVILLSIDPKITVLPIVLPTKHLAVIVRVSSTVHLTLSPSGVILKQHRVDSTASSERLGDITRD